MADSYCKVFQSIFTSSIWQTDPETRLTWMVILTLKDRDGIVDAAVPGLASLTGFSTETIESVLARLLAPDPHSRTPDHDGRRIEVVEGTGWRVLNHERYRDRNSIEEQREKAALRQRRKRERDKRDK